MKKISIFLKSIFLFLLILLLSPLFPVKAQEENQFVPDEVIVKLKSNIPEQALEHLPPQAKVSQRLLLPQTFLIKIPQGQVEKFVILFSRNPGIEYAEPNYIAQAQDITPNDPSFNLQWGLKNTGQVVQGVTGTIGADIEAPQAWQVTTGSASIKIAVLDTGMNLTHEDLQNKIDPVMKDFTGAGIEDQYGHATHVAGIAAADTNNGIGIAGTGFNSKIMVGKVLNNSGSGSYSWIADGIKWSADNGANVINLSLGGSFRSATLENAVNYAWSKGVVLAAAAGNNGSSSKLYPAAYKNVISVAATDNNDKKASFSSFGKWVSVAAPGVNIYSTFPNHTFYLGTQYGRSQNYDYGNGTSMATPFVAGTAALVWSSGKCAPLNNTCVRNTIQNTADKIAKTGSYWKYGRINAFKAVSP